MNVKNVTKHIKIKKKLFFTFVTNAVKLFSKTINEIVIIRNLVILPLLI